MKKYDTFKDAVKHASNNIAKHYRRVTVWFDGYYCILDNHYGNIKKTLGYEYEGLRVSYKEIEDYYKLNPNNKKIEIELN